MKFWCLQISQKANQILDRFLTYEARALGTVYKLTYLQDSMHPTIGILTKRVSHVTGLRTDTFQDESELLQVRKFPHL